MRLSTKNISASCIILYGLVVAKMLCHYEMYFKSRAKSSKRTELGNLHASTGINGNKIVTVTASDIFSY